MQHIAERLAIELGDMAGKGWIVAKTIFEVALGVEVIGVLIAEVGRIASCASCASFLLL